MRSCLTTILYNVIKGYKYTVQCLIHPTRIALILQKMLSSENAAAQIKKTDIVLEKKNRSSIKKKIVTFKKLEL